MKATIGCSCFLIVISFRPNLPCLFLTSSSVRPSFLSVDNLFNMTSIGHACQGLLLLMMLSDNDDVVVLKFSTIAGSYILARIMSKGYCFIQVSATDMPSRLFTW